MNLKITNVQISKYAEEQRMPTLKELADNFCEDDDFEKVIEKTTEAGAIGKLPKISNNNPTAIIAKLKAYPYEFEINSSLQLASIDGVKVANNDTTEYVKKSDYDALLARVVALENNSGSQSSGASASNNYSTDEQVVGTWIDGKPLYQKTIQITTPSSAWGHVASLSDVNLENIVCYWGILFGSNLNRTAVGNAFGGSHNEYFDIWTDGSNVYVCVDQMHYNKVAYVTIQYTKTTDTSTE